MADTAERHDSLHSFELNPASVHFDSQLPGEVVVLIVRQHPVTQIPWLINSIFITILIILLNFVLPLVFTAGQITFFNVFGAALLFAYIWYNFLLWFFNVGIITNQRIIDVDFRSILYKEVSIARLDKIEEVTSRAGGYVGSLFDYGNVYVETASNEINIEFEHVPHPSEVVEIINSLTPA